MIPNKIIMLNPHWKLFGPLKGLKQILNKTLFLMFIHKRVLIILYKIF